MEILENIAEYYDEIYPVTASKKNFFTDELSSYPMPVKLLRIGCATGSFEHQLAKTGIDVTGIENINELLESANRKRRTQLMSIRFFKMTTLEMGRFLGKGFYNVISILDDRIIFTHDTVLLRKLFFDCKQLLTKNGKMIISLLNYEKYSSDSEIELPEIQTLRATLYARIVTEADGTKTLDQQLETGNGKTMDVTVAAPVYPLSKAELETFATEAGFKDIKCYSSFDRTPFTAQSDRLIAVLS
ncbi:MAG: class I SAM-dependent methyltransferase [Treponema sp.]|nr:class I SAM-dependent methyltransferase [Treponema sp.]